MNQLWAADIIHIRLQRELLDMAMILDAYSRRCIGWKLGIYLDACQSAVASKIELKSCSVAPDLVHHLDRSVQYAWSNYTALLRQHGIQISISRRGGPYDNAIETLTLYPTTGVHFRCDWNQSEPALRSSQRRTAVCFTDHT